MKKTTLFILIMALLLGSVLYGCVGNDPVNPDNPDNPVDSPDEVTPYDAALTVDLSELSADITANSPVEIQGSSETLTITEAGNYVLSGNFSQGVVISAGDKETVHLFLENASTSSAQCVLCLNATSSLSAGSTITVRDSEGSVIIQITLVKSAQTFIISSPDFVLNGTYTISSGSSVLATVTLTSTVTTSGRSGGNGGNPGGGRPGR